MFGKIDAIGVKNLLGKENMRDLVETAFFGDRLFRFRPPGVAFTFTEMPEMVSSFTTSPITTHPVLIGDGVHGNDPDMGSVHGTISPLSLAIRSYEIPAQVIHRNDLGRQIGKR